MYLHYWGSFLTSEVLWVSADAVDVRDEPQHATRTQAISSSNFLMGIWGVILIPFEKT